MDVHADRAGVGAEPVTSVLPSQPPGGTQGQLFGDSSPTFADTDKIPVVATSRRHQPAGQPSRGLRTAVVVVAVAVLGAGAALALVEAGVISTANGGGGSPASSTPTTTHGATHPTTHSRSASLLTPLPTNGGTPTYFVPQSAYTVTLSTSTGPSWVSLGATGQAPAFAGIVPPASSHQQALNGPSTVEIGAGGTKLTVTAGRRSETLTPPSAPFTYQFATKP